MSTTNTTTQKRNQIKNLIDDFATFQWRGTNAWEEYGAFILNEKSGSLKFFNGPGFSNEYSSPMFSSSSGNLLGIKFQRQTIKFKVGIYWFSIEEYQEFLNWISPYEINYLSFGYDLQYGYLVKLANISDSTRYVIGYEDNNPRYYTELELNWEIQGEPCVRSNVPYEWITQKNNDLDGNYIQWKLTNNSEIKDQSLLDTPILLEVPLVIANSSPTLKFQVEIGDTEQTLFQVNFQNLVPNTDEVESERSFYLHQSVEYYLIDGESFDDPITKVYCINKDSAEYQSLKKIDGIFYGTLASSDTTSVLPIGTIITFMEDVSVEEEAYSNFERVNPPTMEEWENFYAEGLMSSVLNIRYDSETGLIFLQVGGNSTWKILTNLISDSQGDYIVDSSEVNKYKLPGRWTTDVEMDKVSFKLYYSGFEIIKADDYPSYIYSGLTIYSRKNII